MKVAVLGPSPAARQIAQKLHELGASVRLFWPSTEGYTPELAALQQDGVLVGHPWLRVTKRLLLPGQRPGTQSRFVDLFRVTYQVDPTPIIEKGKAEQPEVYEKMTEDFLASLTGKLEMFEDVDVVIDAAPGVLRGTMGPGGLAVGEAKLREGSHLVLGPGVDLDSWIGDAREVAVIGAGHWGQEALLQLEAWLALPGHRLFVVTSEVRPYQTEISAALERLLKREAHHQEQELRTFMEREREWQELDDFVKAKKPRPELPIPRLVVFSGHVVTAADELVDKSRTFLTCETIPWAPGEVQPENNGVELKTIGVDRVLVATGTRRAWERFQGLDLLASADGKDARSEDGSHPEVGFYTLTAHGSAARQLSIIQSLEKLFSRVGA